MVGELVSNCNHFIKPSDLAEGDAANINVLELYPALVGLVRWRSLHRSQSYPCNRQPSSLLHDQNR